MWFLSDLIIRSIYKFYFINLQLLTSVLLNTKNTIYSSILVINLDFGIDNALIFL